MTLASLASDTNLSTGRQSAARDNSTALDIDDLVGGIITASTLATVAGLQAEVWLAGSYDGTTYSAGASGTDSAFSPGSKKTLLKLLTIIPFTTLAAATPMQWGPFSVAQAFGGVIPQKWSVFIVHNSSAALNASSSLHEVKYTPINFTSA